MAEPPNSPTPSPTPFPDPSAKPNPPAGAVTAADRETRRRYWRTNVTYLAVLLSIWFVCSYGLGILLAEPLNRFAIGGAPLGFWFAQQGSIYIFLVLIGVYVVLMNRLDRKHGFRED